MKAKDKPSTAMDYLGSHGKIAALMQTARELSAIQKDCARILPAFFSGCQVMRLENGTLHIGVPNQAIATRLRQQIPVLKNRLGAKDWPVNAIQLKILLPHHQPAAAPAPHKNDLPVTAYASFLELYEKLESDGDKSPLSSSLRQLLLRHHPA